MPMSIVQPNRPNEQPGGGDVPPDAPVEIELKLRAAPEDLDQRRGATLRVRRIGQRFVQTLKTERRGDGLARGEWEVALPAMSPAVEVFDDPEARALLDGIPAEALSHLFTSRIQRETRILAVPDAVVECAFDVG